MSGIAPRLPWPADFPDVIVQQPPNSAVRMKDQPGYEAAKRHYDIEAAWDVVHALLDEGRIAALRALIGRVPVALVPVESEEGGRNALPLAYAEALGHALGCPVHLGIVQTNRTFRTGSDSAHRLVARAAFDGEVQPGARYVIVDDVVTQGGTLADLRGFIEGAGGRVVAATTLIGSVGSHELGLRPATLEALRDRFGKIEPEFQEAFGHGYDGLTNSEARALLRLGLVDAVRDRVLAPAAARRVAPSGRNPGGQVDPSLAPAQALAPGEHRFPVRVYYEDTDAGGVVYHANYLKLAERARTEALRALGAAHAELTRLHGLVFMVRRAKLDYLRPARLDDSLVVVTRSESVGAASVELRQAICLERSPGAALAVLDIQLACVRVADMRAARIPPRWRAALAALADGGS